MWDKVPTEKTNISQPDTRRYSVDMSWENEARLLLKAEIARRGVTYDRLAQRLQSVGVQETTRSIANKMSRGTFSFVFFLQCMRALGAESATISIPRAQTPLPAGNGDLIEEPCPEKSGPRG